MSYLRLSTTRLPRVLLARPVLALGFGRNMTKTLSKKSQMEQHHNLFGHSRCTLLLNGSTGFIAEQHTASAKPIMTKSLLKWKKRKRKSKAQQQKEMENLQRDLVKLLTKRAIQVVRNKSLLNAHREVVTCHAFDHQSLHDYQKDYTLVDGSPTSMEMIEQPCNTREHKSYYVAQAVEAKLSHMTKQTTDSRDKTVVLGKALSNNQIENFWSAKDPGSHVSRIGLTQEQLSLIQKNSITYSDIFHTPSFKLNSKSSGFNQDFLSAFENFSSELSVLKNETLHNHIPEWDAEVYSLENHYDSTSFPSNTTALVKAPFAVKPQPKNLVTKEKDFQRNSNPSQVESFDESGNYVFFSEDLESQNSSKWSPMLNGVPSLFVHDPIDRLDDRIQDSLEHEFSQPKSSKKTKATTVRKKTPKLQFGPIHKVDPHGAPLDAVSPEDDRGILSINQEMREILDISFVEACCFTNSELLAVRNLQYYATKSKVTSVHVFNVLMHTLAKKGDLQTIKSLFLLLRQQGLEPTLQTYAACLECVGRMSNVDIELCRNLISDIKKSNLDLADIARKCFFQLDEWDHIYKAIKLVEPDFIPNVVEFKSSYDNKLLLGLNTPNNQRVENNQYALDISHEEMMQRAKQQLDREVKGEVKVKSIAAAHLRETLKPEVMQLRNDVLTEWRKVLLDSFDRHIAVFEKNAHDNINMTVYPFLKLFPREEYVNIIFKCLKELLTLSSGYSPSLYMIKFDLGWAVNRKFNIALRLAGGMDKKVGKFLLDMILYDLKVNANTFKKKSPKRMVPAFSAMVMSDRSTHINAELKLHPVVSRLFAVDTSEFLSFTPYAMPMLVPPVPWISSNSGSLLLGSNAVVRMRPNYMYLNPLKTAKKNRYSAVLDSLNTLSACAWQMNKPILDLQIEVFNNKGESKLKIAPPASELPPLPVIKQDLTPKEKAQLYKKRVALQQQRQDAHGLWCTDLYRLSIANEFRDEIFWFPHSMDFRGRTYPLPPHFNHLGGDNVRAMILFAKGKPLGEKGYEWLKIHLINLTGLKKRSSNGERLEYANEVMEDILDSADRPFTGNKWWQASDEPWQTLACCMEIAKIERFEGDKADYICHFPVHQDGSCNGLQHYAAIGRDQAGAESVNLYPFDVPKDLYSDVVDLVEKARQADAEGGVEIAKVLEGFIKRKVIKQTIMTTVYGVTRYGAREQIHRQLKDIKDFPRQDTWKGSLYLTETTFNSLREIFTAAKDIQVGAFVFETKDWLTEIARLMSSFMPVDWITPLGFPVVQPYFKKADKHTLGFERYKPNILKQKNAFPPNYIHSLDSTHMMLTALYCEHAGITFVSVHDCYWTHAGDVPEMNRICREQFVSMHKQPLLENLSKHLIGQVNRASRDPNLVQAMKRVNIPALLQLLQNVPSRGSFDLDNVVKSTYFFS
ncbi:DNA-directed RNA polymerase [Elysia marginata]|uniref:DNA-directed RNA polymerase n=1 Tax=Elysia marginata TaxID=1093978 RepID=A0AAV4J0A9_9GAST|nr:DNA-directed RNA polymerase [Elysia marginata]